MCNPLCLTQSTCEIDFPFIFILFQHTFYFQKLINICDVHMMTQIEFHIIAICNRYHLDVKIDLI